MPEIFWQVFLFESSVNSEGIETPVALNPLNALFESSVNSEGIETISMVVSSMRCLRAV